MFSARKRAENDNLEEVLLQSSINMPKKQLLEESFICTARAMSTEEDPQLD